MSRIFVQIAAYRDPELVPTIKSLFQNAAKPDNLRVYILRQYSPEEHVDEIRNIPNVIIEDIPYIQSQGVCWARSQIQQHYSDEEYTLCLDSHHRFVKDWDITCIEMIKGLQGKGVKKPLLTGYLPSYTPKQEPQGDIPWKMNIDKFIPEGAIFFLPSSIDNFKDLESPIPARFFSAHFVFTLGVWNKEVPYDPNYYFHGEEINLAVRSFTHGYDLFHTHKIIAWHEYTRNGRTKQWDDDKDWYRKNDLSHLRNRKLFGMDNEPQDIDFGIFYFGKERSLEDYEKYAGVNFKLRAIQQYTLEHKLPPNPVADDWVQSFTKSFKHCIEVARSKVPETDYDFWCISFKTRDDVELVRQDANAAEVLLMLKDSSSNCKIYREFDCIETPKKWTVWPYSKSKGWCNKIEGDL